MKIRVGCLKRAKRRCEACDAKTQLQVHHLTYDRIFKEDQADLILLCKFHHEAIEELIRSGQMVRKGDVKTLRHHTLKLLNPLVNPRKRKPKPPKIEQALPPVTYVTETLLERIKRTAKRPKSKPPLVKLRSLKLTGEAKRVANLEMRARLLADPAFVEFLQLKSRSDFLDRVRRLFGNDDRILGIAAFLFKNPRRCRPRKTRRVKKL